MKYIFYLFLNEDFNFLNISEKYSTNDILFARFDIGRSKPEFEEKYKNFNKNVKMPFYL